MTISELAKEFQTNYMENRLRPSTIRGYMTNLDKHTLPHLGERTIESLSVDDLDRLTAMLKKSLSNKSIIYVHATLRKMLVYAIKRGYLVKSPYAMFDLPRIEKYHYRVLDKEQMSRLLSLCKGTPLEVPVTLALCYGLRRGECLGIIPEKDLDVYSNVLHVQRTRSSEHGKEVVTPCKTEKSNRLVLLTPEHAKWLYGFQNGSNYACNLLPHHLDKLFHRFLKEHGFPKIRFHDLRHTYATFMLANGVNAKIVSTVLGHSTVSITLDIYSHPDVRMQNVCLQAMARL